MFRAVGSRPFRGSNGFSSGPTSAIRHCSFTTYGWPFEVYGEALAVDEQDGWRYFASEKRLLALCGPSLPDVVLRQREAELKTEPAFAAALDLAGDPYDALLMLEGCSDEELAHRFRQKGVL
ncbi:DUF4269 domain-containing protein [Fulvimarina sp. MAC8]